jgi:hypothetical protein
VNLARIIANATPEQLAEIAEIERQVAELVLLLDTLAPFRAPVKRRSFALAKTHLDQAVLWAALGVMDMED